MFRRIISLAIIAVSFTAAWGWMQFDAFKTTPLALPAEGVIYTLKPGTSMKKLAADLEQKQIISSAFFLRTMARLNGQAGKIQAGEYLIKSKLTPPELLNLFVQGKVTSYSLTLVEGWTFKEMRKVIAQHDALIHTLDGVSDSALMQQLGAEGEHPEGRFFPDTYHFPKGTTDLAFLKRAYNAMRRYLRSEWEQRQPDLPLQTPYEALILASIVERETGVPEERPEIAGVFVRRLQKRMRLQTDPTVIYGMGDRFDGNIRRKDLREDTPYNTYVHKGLPPTPIAMPSAEAIHAALNPAKGESLYFVAKGDGSHQFSATLEAHNRAVQTYQIKRRKN